MKVLVIFAFSLAISTCSVLPRVRLNHQRSQKIRQILLPRPGANDRAALENSQLRRLIENNNYKVKKYVLNEVLKQDNFNRDNSHSDESIDLLKGPKSTYVQIINLKPHKNKYNNKYINLETINDAQLVRKKLKKSNRKNKYMNKNNRYTYDEPRERSNKYQNIFDGNGMIYLSEPRLDEERKLNKLMNKVINYEVIDKKDKYLRKPLSKVFDKEELTRLDKIVKAVAGSDGPTTPRTAFNFSDLVA